MIKVKLVRWNTTVNQHGPLGRRLLMQYMRETHALMLHERRVAREWASYR